MSHETRSFLQYLHQDEQFLITFCNDCICSFAPKAINSWQSLKEPLTHPLQFSLVQEKKVHILESLSSLPQDFFFVKYGSKSPFTKGLSAGLKAHINVTQMSCVFTHSLKRVKIISRIDGGDGFLATVSSFNTNIFKLYHLATSGSTLVQLHAHTHAHTTQTHTHMYIYTNRTVVYPMTI